MTSKKPSLLIKTSGKRTFKKIALDLQGVMRFSAYGRCRQKKADRCRYAAFQIYSTINYGYGEGDRGILIGYLSRRNLKPELRSRLELLIRVDRDLEPPSPASFERQDMCSKRHPYPMNGSRKNQENAIIQRMSCYQGYKHFPRGSSRITLEQVESARQSEIRIADAFLRKIEALERQHPFLAGDFDYQDDFDPNPTDFDAEERELSPPSERAVLQSETEAISAED